MAFSVQGKSAIVTGAGSDLVLRPEAEESVRKHSPAKDSTLGRAIFQKTDVSHWRELEQMFLVAEKEFGCIDIVVPGAGVYEPTWSSFWHPPGTALSKDAADANNYKLIEINLSHPIRTTQLAISHFLERKKPGHVLHVSSVAGQISNIIAPLYNASKHAISGFVRSLAFLDSQFGIRVTAVAPGLIKTPLWTELSEGKLEVFNEGIDEWATPEEVALAMLALIEEDEIPAGKIEGGSVLEVGKDQVRLVFERNDPGPSGPGHTSSGQKSHAEEIFAIVRKTGRGKSKL